MDDMGQRGKREMNAGGYFDHNGNGFSELTGWVAPGRRDTCRAVNDAN